MATGSKLPTNVEEAVQMLLESTPAEALQSITNLSRHELPQLHFGLGLRIRNEFRLWQNHELVMATGKFDPDDASYVIICALWEELQRR